MVIRPEYYTSKTCTKCGNIKHDLKNADIYKCNSCNLKIDRDTNGARNILLRNLCNWIKKSMRVTSIRLVWCANGKALEKPHL